jgi:hypothetical protein
MTDEELRDQVQKALDWEPSLDAGAIGVTVDQGVVTLLGEVKTFAEKATAERVALRLFGVKAVADGLRVRLHGDHERSDTDIAQAILSALRWNTVVPDERARDSSFATPHQVPCGHFDIERVNQCRCRGRISILGVWSALRSRGRSRRYPSASP